MPDDQKMMAEIPTPLGPLRIFSAYTIQIIIILTFALVLTGTFFAYDLREEIQRANSFARKQLIQMYMQNCLLSLPEDDRQKWRTWCRQQSERQLNGE
jgi:hypothetical protein